MLDHTMNTGLMLYSLRADASQSIRLRTSTAKDIIDGLACSTTQTVSRIKSVIQMMSQAT